MRNMRSMRSMLAVCLAVLLFVSPAVFAEEGAGWTTLAAVDEEAASGADASDEPKTLEPVIVTATSIETPVNRVGSSVRSSRGNSSNSSARTASSRR